MPEHEAMRQATSDDFWRFWTDPFMWSCVAMVVLGHLARVFAASEPIVLRKLVAEAVLAAIGAVGIYVGADLQGMGVQQKVLVSVLMSLGGIHLVQRTLQVYASVRKGGGV